MGSVFSTFFEIGSGIGAGLAVPILVVFFIIRKFRR